MRARRRSEDDSSIDLTPMIDVVFILLIFFIVTANFTKETGVGVNRPGAVKADKQDKNTSILVTIDESDQIWMDYTPIDVRQVGPTIQRLMAENPEGSVVVQAHKDSQNYTLVKVVDQARQVGVVNVSLSGAAQ